jgi:nucleotide-binding universal stress UspA family protein
MVVAEGPSALRPAARQRQDGTMMDQQFPPPAIVVGVDGSSPSLLALRWAAALAPALKAHIKAVTAWEFQIAFGTFTPVVWRPDEEARRICADAVSKVFGHASRDGLEMLIRQGPPAKVLVEESRRARLLILGSRGHGGFEGLLLGAVSGTVAEHSHCSVLIAHGTWVPTDLAAVPQSTQPPQSEEPTSPGPAHEQP